MGLTESLLIQIGRAWVDTLTSPSFLGMYLLLIGVVITQYRRLQTMSEPLLQGRSNLFLGAALVSAGVGLVGGIASSFLLVFLGIDLAGIALTPLWIVALLLMLIKPRFLCFSYAAGILCLSHLLFNYPALNVPQMIGLVAILHLVEALLTLVNGALRPFPVYVEIQGEVRGGFSLLMIWPLPLVALLSVGLNEPSGWVTMPAWWPLLQNFVPQVHGQNFTLISALAVLAGGNLTTTRTPRQAAWQSSRQLLLFSLTLLALAVLGSHYYFFLFLAALASPLGHEMLTWLSRRSETGAPLYVPPSAGIMILDVLPKTPAHRNGLRPRDIILNINGIEVNSYHQLQNQLNRNMAALVLQVQRGEETMTVPVAVIPNQDLGIIPVPEPGTRRYLSSEDNLLIILRQWWQKHRTRKSFPPQD